MTGAAGSDGWETIGPEAAGLAPDVVEKLDAAVAAGKLEGLHGVVVARRGALAFERYWPGQDEAWGDDLGVVDFGPDDLHDMRSISKSVVSLLYGIGLEAGELPPLETPLAEAFPGFELPDERLRDQATVAHAFTMTLGLEWNEELPYSDPRNGEIAMEQAPDRIEYVLSRPTARRPGSQWGYCGGATALLAQLVATGAGGGLLEVARERLFDPLGIDRVEWESGRHAEPAAASGLRLRPRDLAKLGRLVVQDGAWEGRQIVPPDWLARSLTPRFDTGEGVLYGYHWWVGWRWRSDKHWYGAFGNGGQRLTVIPSLDLTLAVTAGNYNQQDAWKLPVAVLLEHIFPALLEP